MNPSFFIGPPSSSPNQIDMQQDPRGVVASNCVRNRAPTEITKGITTLTLLWHNIILFMNIQLASGVRSTRSDYPIVTPIAPMNTSDRPIDKLRW